MDNIKIRQYLASDKSRLLELLMLNTPKHFAESEYADFNKYLDTEIEQYFVVELDGIIVGAGGINFENNHKIGKISWDIIHPDFQGFGIGRKLLQHRIVLLKSISSIERILVRTSQFAFKFYEKNEFIVNEVHKDYWADGFDLYHMIYKKN
ncbi:GNAT family N-acetyltransferase [Sphingobacterium alkalisoli]|uniref:GNAT family N-acetyltransferase n=1 Tax=Sphingobacterium alkalisoli TaxID=1874115 RepID=A0A4U0GZP9_9SPHI|nr:GNAT family N-acetyltransferase [Sphingobacterium alkalisoli]TJY64234.1 GNAT family N-acetyltransferase [Sphingobacterium alkalisoli]GGH23009.1 hypothetical protein GCM10011418_29960 [Sphingobacterium alkalisoli]